jgi:septal ring factor EnvC (AmiA/AmiB activator)
MEAGMEVAILIVGVIVGGVLVGLIAWNEWGQPLENTRATLAMTSKRVAEEKTRGDNFRDALDRSKDDAKSVAEEKLKLSEELETAHKHIREFGATLKENVQARHEVQDDLNELRATLFQLSKPKP